MKVSISLFCSALLVLIALNLPLLAENPTSGYHHYAALSRALAELSNRAPQIAQLTSLGKTLGNREIWALQISGRKGKAAQDKPALLICGNAEGDHVIGSEVALGIAEYLITRYGTDSTVTHLLDQRTFYIVPRLNPDGAELFFSKPLREHEGNLRPHDEDFDWQVDEDGPEDLNGDGMITLMRVKDKKGDWVIDKQDARLMIKKQPDTPLDSLYQLYPEGIDNDGDEKYNEDGPGGFNINRNFPHNFGYPAQGYQVYPASEIETRALIDYMNRYDPAAKTKPRQNICAILLFSKYDNLAAEPGIECGQPAPAVSASQEQLSGAQTFVFRRRGQPSGPPQPPAQDPQPRKTDEKDLPLFKKVSQEYKKITGIESAATEKPVGSILEWGYFQYGVPTFSANLWSVRKESGGKADSLQQKTSPQNQQLPVPQEAMAFSIRQGSGERGPSRAGNKQQSATTDQQWLNWIDKQNQGRGFVNWTKFQHPQLGEIEIGGFQPYLRINPPADQIKRLIESHAKFALYLAEQFAEIELTKPEFEKLGNNLFRVKVKVINNGKFPYATAMGQQSRNVNPIMVQLKFSDDKAMKLFGGSKRYELPTLAPAEEKEYKWVIISPPGKEVDISLWAAKGGGRQNRKISLK